MKQITIARLRGYWKSQRISQMQDLHPPAFFVQIFGRRVFR